MIVAGVDEVGRGCLAGPVIASAVILNKNKIYGIKDSKKISSKKRLDLSDQIKLNSDYSFGVVSPSVIDKINIHNASLLAMKKAIENLETKPDIIYVDGLYVPETDFKTKAIVKGDSLIKEISAASILAKVYRDSLMIEYDKKYPGYFLKENKGYPTIAHKQALLLLGPSIIHRRSFKGVL